MVVESLPTAADNNETQFPVAPAEFENTDSMKALLRKEDGILEAKAAGNTEDRVCS